MYRVHRKFRLVEMAPIHKELIAVDKDYFANGRVSGQCDPGRNKAQIESAPFFG